MSRDVRWKREEQTESKHLVLRKYLDGWFPILGSFSGRLLFVDAFAGPGEYAGGEAGSPIIALDCVRSYRQQGKLQNVEVLCLFIEKDKARANHLQKLLAQQPPIPQTKYRVLPSESEETITHLLDAIDAQGQVLAPSFFMIDPFGIKGSTMEMFRRILENRRSEIFFSFMYEPIRRWIAEPEFSTHMTPLFGTDEWRRALSIQDGDRRKRFVHELFREQLKKNGAQFVVPFQLWKGGRHVYTIFFCTGNRKGCNLMKASIWSTAPQGAYDLRAQSGERGILFDTDTEPLARQLENKFRDQWVRIEAVEQFVMGDETLFHKGHLRRKTLQRMLHDGRIERRPEGVSSFSNGRGIEIRFLGTP